MLKIDSYKYKVVDEYSLLDFYLNIEFHDDFAKVNFAGNLKILIPFE